MIIRRNWRPSSKMRCLFCAFSVRWCRLSRRCAGDTVVLRSRYLVTQAHTSSSGDSGITPFSSTISALFFFSDAMILFLPVSSAASNSSISAFSSTFFSASISTAFRSQGGFRSISRSSFCSSKST